MNDFTFNSETHQYFLDGVELPSVTTILKSVGIIETQYYTELGRERGSAVHLACQLLDEDDLDWESLDPQLKEYVRAYKLFLKQSEFKPEKIEERIYHPNLLYAGTPDRIGLINSERVRVLIDIKTGSIPAWTGLQLAGYNYMLDKPCRRYALQLKNDGTYKLKEFSEINDTSVFLSALTVSQWKKKKGIQL